MEAKVSKFAVLLLLLIVVQSRIIQDQFGNPINPHPDPADEDKQKSKIIYIDDAHTFTALGPFGYWRTLPYYDNFFICGVEMRFEDNQGSKKDDTATNGFRFKLCQNSNWNNQRQIQFQGIWGDWKGMVMCPVGHYVMGFQATIESWQGPSGDDTAFNGLDIMCKKPKFIDSQILTVYPGIWGNKRSFRATIDDEFFYKVDIQFQDNQKKGDDTALNGLRFYSKNLY